MHPLRVLFLVSLVIAVAVAWGLGSALVHAGTSRVEAVILAVIAFAAFLVPWAATFLWALRRARDLDELIERTRRLVGGESRPITSRAYHGELDELARAIEELRELMEHHRESTREQRAMLGQIVASLGEGLLAVNDHGRIVAANPRVEEMFGASGDAPGKSVLEVVRKQSVVAAVERARRGEASAERISVAVNGDERQVEVRAVPVAGASEITALALFIDVTHTERLQRIRKEFLDDFSHEVRTPLAGLRSAAETLEDGGLPAEHEQQLRHVILRQVKRIERLVQDLAELNRIESGELVLQRAPVDLQELLAELADELLGDYTVEGEAVIEADPVRVQQIFTNLFDNASKHGGGRVRVEIAREPSAAVVRVSDEGEGIPPSELERIFHRFYRVDKSRSQDVPGLGLGLAIVKHLVLVHGGSIRAYNGPAGGATFEVKLPAA